jgi:hypothetical protein
LSTRSTPKISDSPEAIRNRNIAVVRPDTACAKTNESSGTAAADQCGKAREARPADAVRGRAGAGAAARASRRACGSGFCGPDARRMLHAAPVSP